MDKQNKRVATSTQQIWKTLNVPPHQILNFDSNLIFAYYNYYSNSNPSMIDPLCQKCQQRINHQKSTPPTPKVSLGLLYHLALDLQFSFQAISLVLDFATIR